MVVTGSGTCIVVMGVSGCGKSSVGRLIAQRLGLEFLEGDEFHPAANVAKMSAGVALDDADRAPWLAAIAERLAARAAAGRGAVLACSALKRRYRDRLRQDNPGLYFVYLHGGKPELIDSQVPAPVSGDPLPVQSVRVSQGGLRTKTRLLPGETRLLGSFSPTGDTGGARNQQTCIVLLKATSKKIGR